MPAVEAFLAGPLGPAVAIAAMAVATYLCRVSGVFLMSRVSLTPIVERALLALPGSIVAATVAPIALTSGPAAMAGVVASIAAMRFVHNELAALVAGLAVAAVIRATGF